MEIKRVLINFLRFDRQFVYVATEAGRFNSDVLGIAKNDRMTEFEVKVSFTDFRNDFKKPKHDLYLGGQPESMMSKWEWRDDKYLPLENPKIPDWAMESIPYKFYFVVTKEIEEKCLAYLNERKLPYGLYSFNEELGLVLIKKAPVLKDHYVTDGIKKIMALRMSSEIAGLRDRLESMKQTLASTQNYMVQLEAYKMEHEPKETLRREDDEG